MTRGTIWLLPLLLLVVVSSTVAKVADGHRADDRLRGAKAPILLVAATNMKTMIASDDHMNESLKSTGRNKQTRMWKSKDFSEDYLLVHN